MKNITLKLNEHQETNINCNVSYKPVSQCPLCHSSFSNLPNKKLLISNYEKYADLYCFYVCLTCNNGFIVKYRTSIDNKYLTDILDFDTNVKISPVNTKTKKFDDVLKNISQDFEILYNEAYTAEQYNLKKTCGMGYRKALEFLIKDYLIYKFPDNAEHIKNTLLFNCINDPNYNVAGNIKEVAKRCAWLGNDHSHYVAKHTDKDLNDLKELLEITVYWIIMELKTEAALKIQPK